MKIRHLACLAAGGLLLLTGCERPPVDAVQTGFRGLGMEHISNPRLLQDSVNAIAERVPNVPGTPSGNQEPAPEGTWENVQVLGHLSEEEFDRTMLALTTWVAAETGQGCNYCHVIEDDGEVNFASDDIYTKVVSRDMIRMTQDVNENWQSHVGEAGVNCWTCHQGQTKPANYWFYDANPDTLDYNRYYSDQEGIRVISEHALTGDADNERDIWDTRHLYWLMIDMSEQLGVNCTYCHTSARFSDWEESPPQRVQALRGVRMVRHMNQAYMAPLDPHWPDDQRGELGDGPKMQCATCHAGAYVPQYGLPDSNAEIWPGLQRTGDPHPGSPEYNPGTPAMMSAGQAARALGLFSAEAPAGPQDQDDEQE